MWLYHAPFLMAATIVDAGRSRQRVCVELYTLIGSPKDEEEVTLEHQKTLTLETQCIGNPTILCFSSLSCKEDARIRPHLFLYDASVEQLECHQVELDRQALVGTIAITLGRVEICREISPTGIVIGCKNQRSDRPGGYDIFEWTPEHQRLLQTRLETKTILGIVEGVGSRSQLLYHGRVYETDTVLVTGSSLWSASHDQEQGSKVFQGISVSYRGNIRSILTTNRYSQDLTTRWSDAGSHSRVWAQTRSGELVFFKHGILNWSRNFAAPVREMRVHEILSEKCTPRLCLLVHTDKATYLLDAINGKPISDWPVPKDRVVVADVRQKGLASILMLPKQPMDSTTCTIYPSSAQFLPPATIPTTAEENKKALSNMNCTLGVLEGHVEDAQKKIQRLQSSLTSKSEIVQNCQDLLNGPLRSVFASAGGSLTDSATTQEELRLFRRKKQQRQKRVLERLKPIVGSTVSESFREQPGLGPTRPALDVEECSAGWIQSTNIFWVGAKVRNDSERTIFNLRLSVSQQRLQGRSLARLEPQVSGWVLCIIDIDPSMLEDAEFLDRSLALTRLLSDSILLHFDLREQQVEDRAASHATLAIPKVSILERPGKGWHSLLVGAVLPSKVGCRIPSISRERLEVMLHDGLGLLPCEEGSTFGSLEDGTVAVIGEGKDSKDQGADDAWTVYFSARTDALAVQCARAAVLAGPRFA
ncbi:unnamed protein product [Mortierella alpina]